MLYQVHVFDRTRLWKVELRATIPDVGEYDHNSLYWRQPIRYSFIVVPLPTEAIKAGRWQDRITNLTEIPWRSELEP